MSNQQGKHYSALTFGPISELNQFAFPHPLTKRPIEGKKFLKQDLGLTGMEVSLHKFPGHGIVPFYHKHTQNEELYMFLAGHGEFQVDGEVIRIEPGTAIRVAPEGVRTWRSTSDEEMVYVCIQARAESMPEHTIQDGEAVPGKVEWPQ